MNNKFPYLSTKALAQYQATGPDPWDWAARAICERCNRTGQQCLSTLFGNICRECADGIETVLMGGNGPMDFWAGIARHIGAKNINAFTDGRLTTTNPTQIAAQRGIEMLGLPDTATETYIHHVSHFTGALLYTAYITVAKGESRAAIAVVPE